jgi:phospholipid transport system substrate-binding protein
MPSDPAAHPAPLTAKAYPAMTPRPLRFFVILLAALGLGAAAAHAAPPADATAFIKDLISEALTSLNNKALSDQDREKQFHDVLRADFDMPRISRFVLGPYWNAATDPDKQEFQKLFEEYIVKAYAARFSQYSGEQVKVTGSRPESETLTLVSSELQRDNGASPAKVDWRVRKEDNGYKIVDIDVEGVSMLLTQREQFSSVIQRSGGNIGGLNKTLEEKLASGDTSLAAPPLPQNR